MLPSKRTLTGGGSSSSSSGFFLDPEVSLYGTKSTTTTKTNLERKGVLLDEQKIKH